MKIIVIGAGIASLTFAVDAIKDGHQIILIEKNDVPGGVMALYKENGYSFEQGPLLIGDINKGEPLYNLLDSIGVHLETFRADRGLVYEQYDFCRREPFKGKYWRKQLMKEYFPEDEKGIDEYYHFYETMMKIRYLSSKTDLLSKADKLIQFLKVKKYQNLSCGQFCKKLFKNEGLRMVLTGILADFCADPKEVTCFSIPFLNPEPAFDDRIDVYDQKGELYYPAFNYVRGGIQQVPEALADYLKKKGATILYNRVVTKINIENGIAKSVTLDNGEILEGDAVVADCGAKELYLNLVGKEYLKEEFISKLDQMNKMESIFMLHLGVDIDPMQYQKQALVYYYGTANLSEATEKLRKGIYHEGKDGYLIFVESYHAKEFAPEGKYAMTIYTVAPNFLAQGSWQEKEREYADKLIELAQRQIPDLSKHIVFEKIITPDYYRNLTHTQFHSFGGLVPDGKGYLPPHQSPIDNLYHLGTQSISNAGIAPTADGGHKVYRLIKEKMEGK